MSSMVDVPALLLALLIAAVITEALLRANRGDHHRRGWLVAAALAAALIALGLLDVLLRTPREMKISTVFVGFSLPVLGALGMVRGTRRVRPWARWLLVFSTSLVLLLAGLLIGATLFSHLIPF